MEQGHKSPDDYIKKAENLAAAKQYQKALEATREGLRHHSLDPRLLLTELRILTTCGHFRAAVETGRKLHTTATSWIDHYEPFIFALTKTCQEDEAIRAIETGLSLQPTSLHLTDLKAAFLARTGRHEECKWHLYTSLQEHQTETRTKILTECIYHLETNQKQRNDSKARSIGCDIICIASDEAPYVHNFIHHHLFLGFKNIFIGINKSTDETLAITSKISQRHHNVHLVDTNNMAARFNQYGCYHYLFDYAIRNSDSSHCLFIDIDEFWIANPFPTRISDFMQMHLPFEVYSFHWLCAYNDKMFASPLSKGTNYIQSNWVKSLFSYNTPVSRIGVHGPILDTLSTSPIAKIEGRNNQSVNLTIYGLEICGYNQESDSSKDNTKEYGAIIHMINRSELEYCHRLFKVHANENQNSAYFKTNRYGWEAQSCIDGHERDFYFPGISDKAQQTYDSSREKFIQECEISTEVSTAQGRISERNIRELIHCAPNHILQRDKDLVRRIFKGTRFLSSIEEILND